MRINPVYHREFTVSNRSNKTMLMVLAFDTILATAALISFYSMSEEILYTGEVQFAAMLNVYILVALAEYILLVLIVPALTAGTISGERERQTLELLLSTKLTPFQIVVGKLRGAFWMINTLVISSFPILALVFVYGGLLFQELLALFVYFFITVFFFGSISVFFSALFQRTTVATVMSYLTEVVLIGGTFLVVYFISELARANAHEMMYNEAFKGAGNWIYLLILNPLVNFYGFLNQQAGDKQILSQIVSFFGRVDSKFIMQYWVWIGLGIQIIVSVVCLWLAARLIDPLKGKKP